MGSIAMPTSTLRTPDAWTAVIVKTGSTATIGRLAVRGVFQAAAAAIGVGRVATDVGARKARVG